MLIGNNNNIPQNKKYVIITDNFCWNYSNTYRCVTS